MSDILPFPSPETPMRIQPGEPLTGTVWGILDTQDDLWLGDGGNHLLLYRDKRNADLVVRVLGVRLRWAAGRLRAVTYTHDVVRVRDYIEPKLPVEEALRRLEDGLEL